MLSLKWRKVNPANMCWVESFTIAFLLQLRKKKKKNVAYQQLCVSEGGLARLGASWGVRDEGEGVKENVWFSG